MTPNLQRSLETLVLIQVEEQVGYISDSNSRNLTLKLSIIDDTLQSLTHSSLYIFKLPEIQGGIVNKSIVL